MLSIVAFLFFYFPSIVLSQNVSTFQKLDLPSNSAGPESLAFNFLGRGFYTGISDGRIVKYDGSKFSDAYITSPKRTSLVCDGTNNPALLGPICGRPQGLGFYYKENLLYVADAYLGLRVVGANERLARSLATSAEGVPFKYPDGLDVDQRTGDVYFTDASAIFQMSEIQLAVLANDTTGRLLKYNQKTQQVTVLQRKLGGAAGVAINSDSSYVLVTEFIAQRIQKFWLRGPKAFTSQVIVTFQGRPDNIKRTTVGDFFWVAVNIQRPLGVTVPTAIKIDGNGVILRSLPLDEYYSHTTISEVQQRGSELYIGSMMADFVGLLKYNYTI
ncbi:Strictosidine synthase [Trema orientale]|uniref:Strictosidine synthase n=1 Tax=Trema orientale TaxID=63057 RepID=A0A2P5F4G3_TREOI|nr:Strictosidine synthase [Trema orientale]